MLKRKTLLVVLIISFAITIGSVFSVVLIRENSREEDVVFFNVVFDSKGGTPLSTIQVKSGEKVPVPQNCTKTGYTLNSWSYGSSKWDFIGDKVYKDITLTANWDITTYSISYDLNGGYYDGEYETSYTVESSFELPHPEKPDYLFIGWYDQYDNVHYSISEGEIGDLTLTAKWTNKLVIQNRNDEKCSVEIIYNDQTGTADLTYVPKNNLYHLFNGWLDKDNNLITKNFSTVIQLEETETTYISLSYLSETEEKAWNETHAVVPVKDNATDITSYGMYPKTVVNNSELIFKIESESIPTTLNNYVFYQGEYYAKKRSSLYRDEENELISDHDFDNGVEMIDKTDYWYKVEPIEWITLDESSNTSKMIAKNLLDVTKYYKGGLPRTIDEQTIYPNNYFYSDLREWLNNYFYDNAFYFNSSLLIENEVNNAPSTTVSEDNPFCCDITYDKVYALSYSEYTSKYLTETLLNRHFRTTDYSRSSFALYEISEKNKYCGYVWTRSPHSAGSEGKYVSRINKAGGLNYCWCGANYSCAQPCISIPTSEILSN